MNKQRKINHLLVTGGAGFIGSAFIRYVLQKVPSFKGKCINLDLLTYAGNLANLRDVENDPRYLFQKGDICDQALVEQLCTDHQIDAIIHFAAESHVDRSIAGPQTFIETNVMGTFHLLEVVRRNPHIHFHHVSTDEVYGCLGDTGSFTETTPYQPNSPYSASKAASDHFVRAYGKTYGISTTISNCSNNYGPYQFPEKLIPLMILSCLNRHSLPVYGEGKNVRDWLFVEDHAKALWMLLEHSRKGETYNIGGEEEWKNLDLVKEIIRVIAKVIKEDSKTLEALITFVKDRPGHDFRYAIDCSKIKTEMGWTPEHSFAEGLEKTVRWYIDHQSLAGSVERFIHEETRTVAQ
ncbi:MAG: dTDP-glucose 4,6-dehydratase [Parachlamydiaceae bacterium]